MATDEKNPNGAFDIEQPATPDILDAAFDYLHMAEDGTEVAEIARAGAREYVLRMFPEPPYPTLSLIMMIGYGFYMGFQEGYKAANVLAPGSRTTDHSAVSITAAVEETVVRRAKP